MPLFNVTNKKTGEVLQVNAPTAEGGDGAIRHAERVKLGAAKDLRATLADKAADREAAQRIARGEQ
jgi:hypothetical protein